MSDHNGNIINHHLFIRENKQVSFSPDILEKVKKLIARYPGGEEKSALLPVLHIAQEELEGYLSVDVMDYVASLLNIQAIEVYEVATFYTMFHLEKRGRYLLEVCRTGPCVICGGDEILEYLEERLGITDGETTADGMFTLRTVECLGACGNAPVMQINSEFSENLTKEKIDSILEDLKNKARDNKPFGTRWAEKFF